jgi:hypothetical protein
MTQRTRSRAMAGLSLLSCHPATGLLAAGGGLDHPARAVLLPELGALRVILDLGLVLGVEVVEVAEKVVEPVVRGQEFVLVAEVVLAELERIIPGAKMEIQ